MLRMNQCMQDQGDRLEKEKRRGRVRFNETIRYIATVVFQHKYELNFIWNKNLRYRQVEMHYIAMKLKDFSEENLHLY